MILQFCNSNVRSLLHLICFILFFSEIEKTLQWKIKMA